MKMCHGSLFSGIGGFDLGFRWAGIETTWQVEIDEYCRKVLARHFPDAVRHGDIREVHGAEGCNLGHTKRSRCTSKSIKSDRAILGQGAETFTGADIQPCSNCLPYVDIISGGFPCQDISVAGKQAGIEGSRSGLWSEMHRIIGELRPRYTVIENVPNLIRLGLERVLCDLAEIGYDAEWQIVGADDIGAPHRRKRIWIVAYASQLRCESDGELAAREHPRQEQARPHAEQGSCDVAYPKRINQGEYCKRWSSGLGWWQQEPAEAIQDARERGRQEIGLSIPQSLLGRVAHGIPARVDRLKSLGNAIVPQIAQMIGARIVQIESERQKHEA